MFNILHGIYRDVKSCVRTKDKLTDYFDCPIGVRQGCMLSPFLFSFFINELSTKLHTCGRRDIQLFPDLVEIFCLLFADDIALISDSVIGLQCLFDNLSSHCKL